MLGFRAFVFFFFFFCFSELVFQHMPINCYLVSIILLRLYIPRYDTAGADIYARTGDF